MTSDTIRNTDYAGEAAEEAEEEFQEWLLDNEGCDRRDFWNYLESLQDAENDRKFDEMRENHV